MIYPWSIYDELRHYIHKHEYVSSACRLTHEEEMLLIKMCSSEMRDHASVEILNRKAFVTGVGHLHELPQDVSIIIFCFSCKRRKDSSTN